MTLEDLLDQIFKNSIGLEGDRLRVLNQHGYEVKVIFKDELRRLIRNYERQK